MNLLRLVPVGYEPQGSVISSDPKMYINNELFCKGELLKILIHAPGRVQENLRIRIFDSEKSPKDVVRDELMMALTWHPLRKLKTIDTSNLSSGLYIAQVYSSGSSFDPQPEAVLGEHRFQILPQNVYDQYWRSQFGDVWDQPLYWDTLKTEECHELLRGSLLDSLSTILSEGVELDGKTLYQLICPIIVVCMASEMGHLPFVVESEDAPMLARLPHIDMTKLIWLLNVLTPTWADIAFFSQNTKLHAAIVENTFRLNFEVNTERPPYTDDKQLYHISPLFNLVKESARDIPCNIHWDEQKSCGLEFRAE